MPTAFHDFEHAGWQRAAAYYADTFGTLTVQATEPLLDAAAVAPARALLDVASGPGYVAAAAAARGATVVGLDFSTLMVEEARRRYPAHRLSGRGRRSAALRGRAASMRWS